MKRVLLFLLQFIAFLLLLGVGGYWDIVHLLLQAYVPALRGIVGMLPLIKFQVTSAHDLVANGLIFAAVFYILILLFELLRKSIRPWMTLTTVAFLVAVILTLALKVGLPPHAQPENSYIYSLSAGSAPQA